MFKTVYLERDFEGGSVLVMNDSPPDPLIWSFQKIKGKHTKIVEGLPQWSGGDMESN